MKTRCKLCNHPDKSMYESMYASGEIKQKAIGQKIGASEVSVYRHFTNHLMRSKLEREEKALFELTETHKAIISGGGSIVPEAEVEGRRGLAPSELDAKSKLLTRLTEIDWLIGLILADKDIRIEKKVQLILSAYTESRKTYETMGKFFEMQLETEKVPSSIGKLVIEVVSASEMRSERKEKKEFSDASIVSSWSEYEAEADA